MNYKFLIIIMVSLLQTVSFTGNAGLIIDQDHIFTTSSGSAAAVESYQTIAQTFTVGISGKLSAIDLLLFKNEEASGELTLSIYSTFNNAPDTTAPSLFSQSYPVSMLKLENPLNYADTTDNLVKFNLSSANIKVVVGEVYAYVLTRSLYTNPDWVLAYELNSSKYMRGGFYLKQPQDLNWRAINSVDLGFRTYVSKVPEPSTHTILALGLMGLASRRFKKKYRSATVEH